jgi:GH15 family glucan-1,4-alpha-glucosidase
MRLHRPVARKLLETSRSATIGEYGLIGDTRTAALVSGDGSIEWLCLPRFDSPPVFGALVGGASAGSFRVAPRMPVLRTDRRYRPDSASLEITWFLGYGRLRLTDGMVCDLDRQLLPTTLLVRHLVADDHPVDVNVFFAPRFGERHVAPRVQQRGHRLVCQWGCLALSLQSTPAVVIEPEVPVTVTVRPGTPLVIAMGIADREPLIHVEPTEAWRALLADERRWQTWADDIPADLPHRDAVLRSLITLRLLSYAPSGAPVAAPTTSLPEELGGSRNWDYRYAWPRDASIGIGAFLGVDKSHDARRFMAWLLHASRLDRPRLPVLFTLDGKPAPAERAYSHWPGYRNSRPVRVGNGARDQNQLDGYGWVVDAASLLESSGSRLGSETWRAVRGFTDEVTRSWHKPDAGIWETRAGPAQHVHSKLMAWLAIDRALRIAETHRLSRRRRERWERARSALADDIVSRGYDQARNTFTRTYGSQDLDAALLILPLIGIEAPDSPRVVGTIEAIRRDLGAGGPLLYRYPPAHDGLSGTEGAFIPCTFWLIQALAKSGQIETAIDLFDQALRLANPLDLFAEEIDPRTHEHLGNFPQALSHATLVQAALAIREAHRARRAADPTSISAPSHETRP